MKKIAIVHDYFFQFGGAEKVVEKWIQMYPEATIYTSFITPDKFEASPAIQEAFNNGQFRTTWLQNIFRFKLIRKFQKHLFWLYPIVMSLVRVKNYDAVLISSTYCAKNVKLINCVKVVHYCHSPTRYLHGMVRETDLKTINPILRKIIPLFTFWLKWMDLRAVGYLNKIGCIWIANSNFIKQTIQEVYHTQSQVIYPPIELNRFSHVERIKSNIEDFYFYFGRISFHKKVDLIVESCLKLRKRVIIAGLSGFQPEMDKLRQKVADFEQSHPESKNLVQFVEKRVSDAEVSDYLSRCRAFLYPPKEDSGMVPVEVLSSGTPVIAYAAGGALEYIQDNLNGVFFSPQTSEALAEGILKFEKLDDSDVFDSQKIKQTAQPFAEQTFVRKIQEIVG